MVSRLRFGMLKFLRDRPMWRSSVALRIPEGAGKSKFSTISQEISKEERILEAIQDITIPPVGESAGGLGSIK